jgi:hypothetical protein
VRCLHGKSLPSPARGELLRVDFPNGTGVFIIMWAPAEDAKPRTAAMVEAVKSILKVVENIVPDEEVSV